MSSPGRYWLVLLVLFGVENRLVCTGFSARQTRRRRPRQSGGGRRRGDEVAALAKALQIIYRESGTLGVLNKSDGILEQYKATSLVKAAINASQGNKGVASGILNAFLGAAVYSSESSGNDDSDHAIQLINAYDQLGTEYRLEPDLVALSLAYVATQGRHPEHAQTYLQRAEQFYSTDNGQQEPTATKDTKSDDVWYDLKQKYDIQLLQDDKEFVVLSKPSGMVCYHANNITTQTANNKSSSQPQNKQKKKQQSAAAKLKDMSLEMCLLDGGVPLSTLNSEGRGMVHRIDRGTSGCLVLAKTNSMHAQLLVQFFLKKQIQKSYQALVVSPKQQKLLQKEGFIGLDIDGRPAQSHYHLEQSFFGAKISRIRVETEQGRRHQVRLHCAQGLGAPIVLDPLYGGISTAMSQLPLPAQDLCRKIKAQKKFCLHANSLAIPNYEIDVQAPLPEWWQELEELLANNAS